MIIMTPSFDLFSCLVQFDKSMIELMPHLVVVTRALKRAQGAKNVNQESGRVLGLLDCWGRHSTQHITYAESYPAVIRK
jgi:hypothetical protein